LNGYAFTLISLATRFVGPRVLKNLYRERWIEPPAGFVRLNRYVIYDVYVPQFVMQYDVYGSRCPDLSYFVRTPPPCASSQKSHYICICSGKLHSQHLKYNLQASSTQMKDRNDANKANFASMFLEGESDVKIDITHRSFNRLANGHNEHILDIHATQEQVNARLEMKNKR